MTVTTETTLPRHSGPGAALRERIQTFLDNGLNLRSIGIESGTSEADLRAWMEWRDNDAEAKVKAWLTEIDREATAKALDFVETPTALRIFALLERVQKGREIGTIFGSPGVGKSLAIDRFIRDQDGLLHRWAVMIQAKEGMSFKDLEGDLMDAIGMDRGSYPRSQWADRVCDYLSFAFHGGNPMIVVDEVQLLAPCTVDSLRWFNDRRHIAIILVGNETGHARIHGGKHANLRALDDRIFEGLLIQQPEEGDIDAIIDAWGIRGRACRRFLVELVMLRKSLRGLRKALEIASRLAIGKGGDIGLDDLKAGAVRAGLYRGE